MPRIYNTYNFPFLLSAGLFVYNIIHSDLFVRSPACYIHMHKVSISSFDHFQRSYGIQISLTHPITKEFMWIFKLLLLYLKLVTLEC